MRDLVLFATIAAVSAVSAVRPARADEPDYVEQVVIADVTTVVLLVAVHRSPALGLSSYALLTPALHLAHGEADRAAASLALRLIPVASLATLERCEGGEAALGCGLGHVFFGVAGALAVTAIDAFVIADGDAASTAVPLLRGSF